MKPRNIHEHTQAVNRKPNQPDFEPNGFSDDTAVPQFDDRDPILRKFRVGQLRMRAAAGKELFKPEEKQESRPASSISPGYFTTARGRQQLSQCGRPSARAGE